MARSTKKSEPRWSANAILRRVYSVLMVVVRALREGGKICITKPVVLSVVGAAFLLGGWLGVELVDGKIEVQNVEIAELQAEKARHAADAKRRLANAEQARRTAEESSKAADDREAKAKGELRRLRSEMAKKKAAGETLPAALLRN